MTTESVSTVLGVDPCIVDDAEPRDVAAFSDTGRQRFMQLANLAVDRECAREDSPLQKFAPTWETGRDGRRSTAGAGVEDARLWLRTTGAFVRVKPG